MSKYGIAANEVFGAPDEPQTPEISTTPAAAPSKYSVAADEVFDEQRQRASTNIVVAGRVQPDQVAGAADLARRFNVPLDVAVRQSKDLRQRANDEDAKAIAERNALLERQLAEKPDLAKQSIDDLGNMSEMLGTMGAALKADKAFEESQRSWGEVAADTGLAVLEGAQRLVQLPGVVVGAVTGNQGNAYNQFFQGGIDAAQQLRSDRIQKGNAMLSARLKASEGWREKLGVGLITALSSPTLLLDQLAMQAPGLVAGGVAGAVTSAPAKAFLGNLAVAAAIRNSPRMSQTLAILAERAAPVAGAVAVGAAQQAQETVTSTYTEAMKFKLDAYRELPEFRELVASGKTELEAREIVASDMGARAGMLALPLSVLSQALPGGSTIEGVFARQFLRNRGLQQSAEGVWQAARKGLLEAPSEALEEGGANLAGGVQLQAVDPNRDVVGDAAGAAGVGAGMGVAMGGGIALTESGFNALADRSVRAATEAGLRNEQLIEQGQKLTKLGEIFKTAAASKLRERNPQEFAQWMQESAETIEGAPTAVYVDADALNGVLAQMPLEEVQKILPSVVEQLQTQGPGMTVEIPIGEFTAAIVGTPLEQQLVPLLRTAPDALNGMELQQASDTAAEYLQQLATDTLAQAEVDETARDAVREIRTTVLTELNTAQRFSPEVNGAYAELVGNFYTVLADTLGVTPAEAFQQYRLRIGRQPDTGGVLNSGPQYPLAPRGEWYGEGTFEADGGRMVFVTPDAYLAAVRPLTMDPESRENIDLLKEHMQSGKTLDPLLIRADGREDGRHRAWAAKELGMQQVPVIAYGNQFASAPTGSNPVLDEAERLRDLLDDETVALLKIELANYTKTGAPDPLTPEQRAQAERALAPLVERANAAQAPFSQAVRALGEQLGAVVKVAPVKGTKRAAEKLVLEASGNVADIKDLVRATVVVSEVGQIRDAIAAVEANFKVLRVKNRFEVPLPTGYRDVLINVELPNGVVGEIQINVPGMMRAKSSGHKLYEMQRAGVDPEREARLEALQARVYSEAFAASSASRSRKAPSSPGSAGSSREISALESGLPSSNTAPASDTNTGTPSSSNSLDPAGTAIALISSTPSNDPIIAASDNLYQAAREVLSLLGVDMDGVETLAQSMSDDAAGQLAYLTEQANAAGYQDPDAWAADDIAAFMTAAVRWREMNPAEVLEQGPRGTFNPSTLTMVLNENADLSTFLHETGHFFLEVMADVASRADAPDRIANDMTTVLEWFGVKDVATWQAMTLDEKRPHHERFAESFEQYLLEGRAPSVALQPLFRRFRSWLINVYRSLVDFMAGRNLEISADVRAVFDRLLATDEQIREAEETAGMLPDFEATNEALERLQARSIRDMKWAVGARSRVIKKLQAEAKALRKDMADVVQAEVDAMPVFVAKAALDDARKSTPESKEALREWERDRKDALVKAREDIRAQKLITEGAGLKGLQKGQFLASKKREIENEAEAAVLRWEKDNPRPEREIQGGDLEMATVASANGFDSVDAMLQAIAGAGRKADVVEALVDQRMLERHGDLIDQRAIEKAATEAVHNEARARALATELKAQDDALNPREQTGTTRTGRAVTVNALVAAAKEFGRSLADRRRIRDINKSANAHRAAEARAAKKWREATAAGDTAAAIQAKRDQLLNNYAAKALLESASTVESSLEYLKKFDKEGTRKALPVEYLDQIDKLLERMDLRVSTTGAQIDRRKSLAQWVEAQEEAGLPTTVPDYLLEDAQQISYKELTLEEFRGLVDAVKNIEHLGRLKNKLLLLKDKREFAKIRDEIAALIEANGGKPKDLPLGERRGIVPWLQGFWASHRKMSSLALQMSGGKEGGPLWDALIRPMNEQGTVEAVMNEKATMRLAEIYDPIFKLPGGVTGPKVYIPEISRSLDRTERLAIALNWGNPANQQRLRDGYNWTPEQIFAVLGTLTPVEAKFVNDVWAFIDSFWPDVKAKQLRVAGVTEEKVEAVPFTITLADGTQADMRGGYYPIKYNADRSGRAESQEAAQVQKDLMRGAFTRATTRRGHTKARVDEVKRPLLLDLGVITQHVTQVTHDLAWHEWTLDANRLLGDQQIADAIRAYYGPDILRTMKDAMTGIATADVVPQTKIDSALNAMRANISRSVMGVSFTTALLQPFGLTQSMARIGTANVLRGLARWGGDAVRMESTLGWVREKSDFMRLRSKTFNREIREIKGRVVGKSKTMTVVDAGLFMLMTKMQLVADIPTWVGAYEGAIAAGLDDATAVARADQAVLDSQGGGQIKDLAEVQRKHPMLTQFYSYFSGTLNLTAQKTANTDFKNPAAVAGWLSDMALLLIIPAIAPALVIDALRGGLDDDEPEEVAEKLIKWQVGYLFGMVVGLRELSGAISGFDYAGPPAGRIVADIGKAGQQTAQGEIDEPAVMAYIRLLGSAFGIPTVQLTRSYKGWVAWSEGEAPASALLMGPPPKD